MTKPIIKWDRPCYKCRSHFCDASCKEPEQEPVAWELRAGKTDRVLIEITNNPQRAHDWKASLEEVVPLYTTPPQREWVGLTDEEYKIIRYGSDDSGERYISEIESYVDDCAKAIEAKLREKNGG